MKVTVTTSARFGVTPDGEYVSTSPVVTYDFWRRYLEVFDEVEIVARSSPLASRPPNALAVTGPGVRVAELPIYSGIGGFIKTMPSYVSRLRTIARQPNALITRVPCPLGFLVTLLKPRKKPYCVEVIGDVWDSLSPQGFDSALRVPLRYLFTWFQKLSCRYATGASYVTEFSLQDRYPPSNAQFDTHYSSIELSDAFTARSARLNGIGSESVKLAMVGTLDRLYKSPDILLKAIAKLRGQGLDIRLDLVGGGRLQEMVEGFAREEGVAEVVNFRGHIADRSELIEILLDADMFVLPSRQEGLPRAMIEAMALGLPCVGSDVGGIKELIPPDCLVQPNDVESLVTAIARLLGDRERCLEIAALNKNKALSYLPVHIEKRRTDYYQKVERLYADA